MIHEMEDGDTKNHNHRGFLGKVINESFAKDDFVHELAPGRFWRRQLKEDDY